jgi:hypothetical protein
LNAFCAKVSDAGLQLFSRQTNQLLQTLPIVPASEEHRSFIISTWVKSYESHARKLIIGPANIRVNQAAYRAGEAKVAERHWKKAHVIVSPDDAYTIHGWVCATEGKLWHCYVPPALRMAGTARGLVLQFAGPRYDVQKPWPYPGAFREHTITFNPWMNNEA